jgi:hypothetical protein
MFFNRTPALRMRSCLQVIKKVSNEVFRQPHLRFSLGCSSSAAAATFAGAKTGVETFAAFERRADLVCAVAASRCLFFCAPRFSVSQFFSPKTILTIV